MITIDGDSMQKARQLLDHIPSGAEQAAARALNRAAEMGKTAASRKARESYTISAYAINKAVKVNPANSKKLIASIKARGTRKELVDFKISPRVPAPGKRKTVSVSVVKTSGMKALKGAFLAYGVETGMLHVLKRTGKGRYPIHIKYGPSIPEMIGGKRVKKYVEEVAMKVLPIRVEHEIDRLLEKG